MTGLLKSGIAVDFKFYFRNSQGFDFSADFLNCSKFNRLDINEFTIGAYKKFT